MVEAGVRVPRHLRPLVLQQLGLPALLLGPYSTTPDQESHLCSTFKTTLGPAWKEGRAQRRLDAQLTSETWSDWAVYWVPLLNERIDISDISPLRLAIAWQQYHGVTTIWPTHLASDLSIPALARQKPNNCPTLMNLPTTEDLMGVAAGVFGFLSNYQEPPPPMVTPGDEAAIAEDDHVDQPEGLSIFGGDKDDNEPQAGAEADFDDLFSARSDSPGPPELLEPGVAELGSTNELFEEQTEGLPLEFCDDVVMASPSPPILYPRHTDRVEAGDVTNLVTEDDFNFFDSPGEPGAEESPPLPVAPLILNEQDIPPAAEDRVPDVSALTTEPAVTNLSEGVMLPVEPVPQLEEPVQEQHLSSSSPKSTIPSKRDEVDIIPSPFKPLLLVSAAPPPSSAYSFPSPAPTPESLRQELVERLRQSKKAKYDYASTWETESDRTGPEEEDEYSGAPPTPESEVDTEDTQSGERTPTTPEVKSQGVNEYGGVVCVGAEWFSLKDELEIAGTLARAWNAGWNESGTSATLNGISLHPERPKRLRLELLQAMDCDRFAAELVASRHFRTLFASPPSSDSARQNLALQPILQDGVILADLVEGGETATFFWGHH